MQTHEGVCLWVGGIRVIGLALQSPNKARRNEKVVCYFFYSCLRP